MRFFRKAPIDFNPMQTILNKIAKMGTESKDNPWDFVGAIIVAYHSVKLGAIAAGLFPAFEQYDRDLLQYTKTQFALDKGDLPYK